MKARIYQPAKTAMQSGRGKTRQWVLEFEPTRRQRLDPLMGWAGNGDTLAQIRLKFDSEAEALAYARRHDIDAEVQRPETRQIRPKAYADNFNWQRREPWSH